MKSGESLVRTFSAEMMKKWHQLCNNASQLLETEAFSLREKQITPRIMKAQNFHVISNNIITIICLKLYKTFRYVPSQKREV